SPHSFEIQPLIQRADHSRSRAPYVPPIVRHGVENALLAAPFAFALLVIGRIEQEIERRFEHGGDFARIGLHVEAWIEIRNDRRDAIAGARLPRLDAADRRQQTARDTSLFFALTQRGIDWAGIFLLHASAWKRDLPRMRWHRFRALREQQRPPFWAAH